LKRDEMVRGRRKLHNLYSLPNIIRMIISRRMRWTGHAAYMGEKGDAYRSLVGKPEGKRALGRRRYRWDDDIKTDLTETGWIKDQWKALVNMVMNFQVP
jgi:hypothetical protein